MARERSLLLDLYAAYHKSGELVERAIAPGGIEADDYAFVSILGLREPVTPTEISREFGLALSTVLFRSGRVIERGYAERVANPADGRSFLLRLTPKGRTIGARAAERLHRAVVSLEARLDHPAAEIQDALLALQRAFDEELADSKAPARR